MKRRVNRGREEWGTALHESFLYAQLRRGRPHRLEGSRYTIDQWKLHL